jgi:AAA family ATP:ADP antiporter
MDQPPLPIRLLRRAVDVRPAEIRALAWAWLYIFSVMSAYYVLRPIRDEMGVAGGVENLAWLFTATLAGMIAINPAFAALVARLPRAAFIAWAYRFFALNLLAFALLLLVASPRQNLWVGYTFFVWTSVFNLFVVSVFWSLMADVFDAEQGKRLFGFIAAGATIGAIAGSAATAWLTAQRVPALRLLIGSAVLLEVAVWCVRRLSRLSDALLTRPDERGAERAPIGGSAFAGFANVVRSRYLINIGVYILLFTVTSTFLYFQQAEVARAHFADRGARTSFFARVDLAVNVLTLATQLLLTGPIMRGLGVAVTLTILPALTALGFGVLSAAPTVWVIVAFQVLRRAGNFALAKPSREVLFTVVPREDKYKAKNFIDTVVYRAGDQLGAWSYAALAWMTLGVSGVALVALPLSVVWLVVALWLGRRQESLARDAGVPATSASASEARGFEVIAPHPRSR